MVGHRLALGLDRGVATSDVAADWTHRMYKTMAPLPTLMPGNRPPFFACSCSHRRFRLIFPSGRFQLRRLRTEFPASVRHGERDPVDHASGQRRFDRMVWFTDCTSDRVCPGRVWQAEHMLSAMRNQLFALACIRHNLPTAEAEASTAFRDSHRANRGDVGSLVGGRRAPARARCRL